MQKNFVFPHKLSRFLMLKDYQKNLGQVDTKGGKSQLTNSVGRRIYKLVYGKTFRTCKKRELSITFRLSAWCEIQFHCFAYR